MALLRHGDAPEHRDGDGPERARLREPRRRRLGGDVRDVAMFDALARLADRRRRLVLIVAGVFVLFAVAYGGPVVSLLDSDDDFEDHQSESVLARYDVERATGQSAAPDMVVLVRAGAPVDSGQAQAKIGRVADALRDPGVA